jgi:hypothetical protein
MAAYTCGDFSTSPDAVICTYHSRTTVSFISKSGPTTRSAITPPFLFGSIYHLSFQFVYNHTFQSYLYLGLPLLALCFGQFLHSSSSSNSPNTLSIQFNSMPIPANQGTAAGAGGILYGNRAFGNPKRE